MFNFCLDTDQWCSKILQNQSPLLDMKPSSVKPTSKFTCKTIIYIPNPPNHHHSLPSGSTIRLQYLIAANFCNNLIKGDILQHLIYAVLENLFKLNHLSFFATFFFHKMFMIFLQILKNLNNWCHVLMCYETGHAPLQFKT